MKLYKTTIIGIALIVMPLTTHAVGLLCLQSMTNCVSSIGVPVVIVPDVVEPPAPDPTPIPDPVPPVAQPDVLPVVIQAPIVITPTPIPTQVALPTQTSVSTPPTQQIQNPIIPKLALFTTNLQSFITIPPINKSIPLKTTHKKTILKGKTKVNVIKLRTS